MKLVNSALPRDLVDHLNRGDCVLFVGDTMDDGVLQSTKLTVALLEDSGMTQKACRVDGCRFAKRCMQPSHCTASLFEAAQLYELERGRQALVRFVIDFMGDSANTPGPLQHALAALPASVIVTTVYDDRLEEALRQAGRAYVSVVRDTDIPFYDPLRVQVIRLRGSVSQPDSLVLTSKDSVDWSAILSPVTRIVLQAHFATQTLLFVGYQPDDPTPYELYRQAVAPLKRFRRLAFVIGWEPDAPGAAVWSDVVTVISGEPLPVLQQLARIAPVRPVVLPPIEIPATPYKFLDYFTEKDAGIFFGRDLEADRVVSTILVNRISVVYGRSGTGKTSLLLARVIPELRRKGYRAVYVRLWNEPSAEIMSAIRGVSFAQLTGPDRSSSLHTFLQNAISPDERIVVVLDQFEEFFLRHGEEVRRNFAKELVECLSIDKDNQSRDMRFVFSLRDDYLGNLDEISCLLPFDLLAKRIRLDNLTVDAARLAILQPAKLVGLTVEDNLAEAILVDVDDAGLEPANLQIVLYELYKDATEQGQWFEESRQGRGLSLDRYRAMGSAAGILGGYLDDVLDRIPNETQRAWARAVLKSMVTSQRTKVALTLAEIERSEIITALEAPPLEVTRLVTTLRQERVIRKYGEEDRYELAHEVMIDKIWAWFTQEELTRLDVRDMVRRELTNFQRFGYLLSKSQLDLLASHREVLSLDDDELVMVLRSALVTTHDLVYWLDRACDAGLAVEDIVLEILPSAGFRDQASIARALGQLRQPVSRPLIGLLANEYPLVRVAAIQALEKQQPDGRWRGELIHECYVPGGPFLMGENEDTPPVHVNSFYISKYPVTNIDYYRYAQDCENPFTYPERKARHPVVGVSWEDAIKYAAWAGMRLLTEAEWEKAASWAPASGDVPTNSSQQDRLDGHKRRYPWGDVFDPSKSNTDASQIGTTTPVDQYSPAGDSPYGVADMAGNVWEWCSSLHREYPYEANDGREDLQNPGPRVLRGGAFKYGASEARCTARLRYLPTSRHSYFGFRLGCSAS